jgi:hypothetical protein
LVVVLLSLVAFGVANADIEFNGVLDVGVTITRIDSVTLGAPHMSFLTLDWGLNPPMDTYVFTGVQARPETVALYGSMNGFRVLKTLVRPDTSTWYPLCLVTYPAMVKFYGTGYGGVEESKSAVAPPPRLAVSPSVVTGRMTVRLQPVGTSRQVVEIRDAIGNVVRTLGCTTGTDGVATETWNREDEFGRLVPEGVYFCRYTASDVIEVRKVLVAR